jgi:D-3-phosphoglycerate dehydrogenase / 2-oxoglutarate reductase
MKIVVAEPDRMAPDVGQSLRELGDVVSGPFADGALRAAVADADVLMVRVGRRVDADLVGAAARLRFIVTPTTGLDHVDLDAAAAAGVHVISLRQCRAAIRDVSATAELTWGLLLALIRAIPAAAAHVASGGWDRNRFWGSQLRNKRLGIIGHGRIGSLVAAYGAAFGMEVVAYDVVPSHVRSPARFTALDVVMRTSDVVSVHVTADPANRGLVSETLIATMKVSAVLLNTSRGWVVDSRAAADALRAGRIAGVAVDVVDGEEHGDARDDPLVACAREGGNVLVTPHVGGATTESIAVAERAVVAELRRVILRSGVRPAC